MKFDKDDRYFLIVFKTKIIIYSIDIGKKSKLVQCYTIAHEKYEEIHDVNFISNAEGSENPYQCVIACKANGI